MLKSSAEILGENNARHLLKSVQNHETLTNNISVNMRDYFSNTLFIQRKSYISNRFRKFQSKILSSFKDKFTKTRRDNEELPMYSPTA